ncbi:MAG: vitamin K epoxide reductase family protein, partial [Candidatus Saccharimonadales bacterium]
PWLLLLAGIVGIAASLILSIENIDQLKNPGQAAACDLSPILSCSSVTKSSQAEVLSFPNPYIGLAGYAIIATIGATLLAGARFKRWFWLATEAGLLLALIFIHYLAFQSLYRIGALCIFCMMVWAVTIPVFWYTTLYNIRAGHIKPPPNLKNAADFAGRHHGDILVIWFGILILLIGKRFWYYWSGLI